MLFLYLELEATVLRGKNGMQFHFNESRKGDCLKINFPVVHRQSKGFIIINDVINRNFSSLLLISFRTFLIQIRFSLEKKGNANITISNANKKLIGWLNKILQSNRPGMKKCNTRSDGMYSFEKPEILTFES